jgi:hypothetical protein
MKTSARRDEDRMKKSQPMAITAVVSATLALASSIIACSPPTAQQATTSSTRPAHKDTCAEVTLQTDLPLLDRVLVPYSQTLLGVEAVWGEEGRRVRVVSGGYLDDVLEAYDDLEEIGEREIDGERATLLASSLLGQQVRAAVWRDAQQPPCDAHVVITTGFDDLEFLDLLSSLELG